MAIELLITNNATGTQELVPVATSEVFRKYWKTGCKVLNLQLIPLLEDGLFRDADIPGLISELGLLRQWFVDSENSKTSGNLVARLDNVMQALERVRKDARLTIE